MKLIITEKQSVAQELSRVLDCDTKRGGYFEGDEYLISWCSGHLLESAEPHEYDPKYKKWQLDHLPISPREWKMIPKTSALKQLKILKELINKAEITSIVHAGDAGREGEMIVREVLNHFKCKKPMERLWISSMEDASILKGFNNLKPGTDYNGLYQAAVCRAKADWLLGVNLSRLFSILYNTTLSVGRVQTLTLAMICERADKHYNFVKQPFYSVELDLGGIIAKSQKFQSKTEAETLAAKISGETVSITKVESKEKNLNPPKLYDLTSLQRDANKIFGYSASDTLKCAQNLYELKILSYPRTDSKYITEDMLPGIPELVKCTAEILKLPVKGDMQGYNAIADNSEVTDHHGLIPTKTAAEVSIKSLPQEELNVFMLVCMRLLAAVSPKHAYIEQTVTAVCAGEEFTVKGRSVVSDGWKTYEKPISISSKLKKTNDNSDDEQGFIGTVKEGQSFTAVPKLKTGHTEPPKLYTEDTLLAAMESAGDMPEDSERKGIGTPATRAEVIESLAARKSIERRGRDLVPTEKGMNLIKILPDQVLSPSLTAKWETDLKSIEKGKLSPNEFMAGIAGYVTEIVNTNQAPKYPNMFASTAGRPVSSASKGEVIGKCPACGNDVAETKKAYTCINKEGCKFALWKDNRYFTEKKKEFTKAMAKAFLKDGRMKIEGLYSAKKDKTYTSVVVMKVSKGGYAGFELEMK